MSSLIDYFQSCMASIELCLQYLADALVDLDLVLERIDDQRLPSDLEKAVELVENLSDFVGQLVDAFDDMPPNDVPLLDREALPQSPRSQPSDLDE